MKKLVILVLVLALLSLCTIVFWGNRKCADSNMYSNSIYWYDNGKAFDSTLVDVFYILPTCVFDWTDSDSVVHHHASLTDEVQRNRMLPSYRLADDIFADSANFFAPYYRHSTRNPFSFRSYSHSSLLAITICWNFLYTTINCNRM